ISLVLVLLLTVIVVRADVAGGSLRAEELLARLLQPLGTQQAPDLVGAERRLHGRWILCRKQSRLDRNSNTPRCKHASARCRALRAGVASSQGSYWEKQMRLSVAGIFAKC